jgi:hypothetical protein
MRPTLWPLALVVACGLTSARAAFWDYTISVPDGREATFELPFSVEYAGSVTIEASWTGPRLLFFGVEGPGRVVLARRSGPSPQRLDLTADAASIARGTGLKLTIKALPARGEASGRLRVTAPDPPDVVALREAELHPPPPPPPPPPAWTLTRTAPEGAPPEVARVYEAVEAFRAAVLPATDGPADACTWQIEFLKYAVAARDRLGDHGVAPDVPTLRYFARLAEAIRRVDVLRTGTNPAIAGPVPVDRDDRRDWLIARSEIVRPIERSLDELTELLRGGHAPALEDEPWLPRFTACLTACERFYDERVRFGGDENAPNRDLAAAQWNRILAAGHVFEALGPFLKEPRPPDP